MSKDTSHTQLRERGRFVKEEKITLDSAIKLAEYVIKGRESYVYDEKVADGLSGKCRNWHRGFDRPSCVVGHILFEWGVPKERLVELEFAGASAFWPTYVDSPACDFLTRLQWYQDIGKPWGESLKLAKEEMG